MKHISIVVEALDGHRGEYIELFRSLFSHAEHAENDCDVGPLRFAHVFSRSVVFSPMLEDHTLKFVAVAFLRSLIGRRSVALLFRPGEAVRSTTLRHALKRLTLRLTKAFKNIRVLTILPFALDRNFERLASAWIYDPQLWDWAERAAREDVAIAATIKKLARGRRIVVALGAQTESKGFPYFARIWSENVALRENFLFVAAGRVAPALTPAAEDFESSGAVLINRFIDDDELFALYCLADAVWAGYSPEYDQASGIFGRAVQCGVPAIIRRGSYLEKLAQLLDQDVIGVPWSDPQTSAVMVSGFKYRRIEAINTSKALHFRDITLKVLARELGLSITAGCGNRIR